MSRVNAVQFQLFSITKKSGGKNKRMKNIIHTNHHSAQQ